MKIKGVILSVAASLFFMTASSQSSFTKEANVVYGNISGATLLMDIYKPVKANGKAIVYIPGSAFGVVYQPGYDQKQLKDEVAYDSVYTGTWVKALVQKGFSVFVINHRNSPVFKYRDIISDCQRAVRYVRSNAAKYSIDPLHIGAMGHSSGGCLSALLGTMNNRFDVALNKTDSVSASVQAVVTLAAPFDLSDYKKPADTAIDNDFALGVMASYIGELPETKNGLFVLSGKFAEASPVSHVSSGDAPMLIYYSNNDPIIPARQAVAMEQALQKNNIAVKRVERIGQWHGPEPDMEEAAAWFSKWLK